MVKIKTLSVEEKRAKVAPSLFLARLIISSVFITVALTLYLLSFINFPALCLITAGALWNFFVDINTFLAFLLSIVVGMLYAMFSIIDGLYVNALLYTLYYIPLQFIVWIMNLDETDMSIKKDKKLSGNSVCYVLVVFVFSVVCCFAFALLQENQVLPMFDAISASMLGLSAFLQCLMYREYYFVRPIALVLALFLWAYVIFINGLSMGALTMILLYSMYFILDMLSLYYYLKTIPASDREAIEEIDNEGRKTLINERIKLYHKNDGISKNDGNDGGVVA